MSDRLHLRPCAGRVCRDPDANYAPLPDAGASVRNTPYWRRRIAAGDAKAVPAQTKPSKTAPAREE